MNNYQRKVSNRKIELKQIFDKFAHERNNWIKKNSFYYSEDYSYMKFLIPENADILDLGCGTGELLNILQPKRGVGIDFSKRMIEIAKKNYPNLEFYCKDIENFSDLKLIEGPFDYIILSDTIGALDDCQIALENIQHFCGPDTRIIIAYYSRMWEPILKTAMLLGFQMPQGQMNWLSTEDIDNLLKLADYEVVKKEWRQLLPRRAFGLGKILNRIIAPLPIIRRACLRNYVVARSIKPYREKPLSTTVLIPCRNERGNIENAVKRIPRFCENLEILFVEGHSQDGTLEEIERVINAYPYFDLKVIVQDGKGKGDAVRKGFENAGGDIFIILDADLTMPPEELCKFYKAIVSNKGEFINGSRLVYQMENEAMRFLNWVANRMFSSLFSWLLNQRFTDTLCGTKALKKAQYRKIEADRSYFGNFDPFGDFDLIFGATKQNLKVIEIPISYARRTYGETQISRFKHGWLLLRMVCFAFKKLKAF